MRLLLILLTVFNLSSCASYIAKMHRQLDGELGHQDNGKRRDNFDQFRRAPRRNSNYQSPNKFSSSNQRYISPKVKRQYAPMTNSRKRYTANDLNDNDNSGSLWTNERGPATNLFIDTKRKSNGDIILIHVKNKLKNEISMELKRVIPPPPTKKKDDEKGKKPASTAAAPENNDNENKIYDKISGVVVEEIKENHVLLRGRKYVLFNNRKRMVEVQALVARRDIASDDSVDSDSILEQSIKVLR